MNYEDKPIEIEKWLETISDKDRHLFDKGFIVCLYGLVETIVDMKQALLDKAMGLTNDDGENLRQQLLSRVHILDVLEASYRKRIAVLEPHLQEQ